MRVSLVHVALVAAVAILLVWMIGRAVDNTFQQAGCVVTPGTTVSANGVCK